MYMEEKEVLEQVLLQELHWVQYRQDILDIMEEKLLQMRELAEKAKQGNLTAVELEDLNVKLNDLAAHVRALDEESRRTEYGKILE